MNSWNTATLPCGNEHQRSYSIAGYNGILNPRSEFMRAVPFWNDNKHRSPHYTSYMDISRGDHTGVDFGRKYSWRSSLDKPQCYLNQERNLQSIDQRPFESAFKAAISKMKETSLSRIDAFDNMTNAGSSVLYNTDNVDNRNYMTLPPRKIVTENLIPRSSHKIFRYHSTADNDRDKVSSSTSQTMDYRSEMQSDKNKNLSSNQAQYQDECISKQCDIHRLTTSPKEVKLHSGSHIIIPAATNGHSVASEAYISPATVCKAQSAAPLPYQSAAPMPYHFNSNKKEDSSTYNVPARERSSKFPNDEQLMTKSLIINTDKPPMKKPQRSVSQRGLDVNAGSYQIEQLNEPLRNISGLYKKNNTTALKGKSLNNLPADFQKLHSAFLEQKKDINALKRELEEKKSYIVKLESEIRSYEPWR